LLVANAKHTEDPSDDEVAAEPEVMVGKLTGLGSVTHKEKAILFSPLHPYFQVAFCLVFSQPLAERSSRSYSFSSVFQNLKIWCK
jgi:hypothetical protein